MASDLVHQGTVTAAAGTLTGANYVEDKVLNVISPDSLLDFQLITSSLGGLSLRDIIFIITAFITIRAAIKVKRIREGTEENKCSTNPSDNKSEVNDTNE